MYNIQDSMISSQEYKNSKLNPKQSTQLIEKSYKLDIGRLNLQSMKQLYPALNNTYICVDYQTQTHTHPPVQPITNLKASSTNTLSNFAPSLTNISNSASLGLQGVGGTSTAITGTNVGIQNNNQVIKKIIHFTSDCKILGQLVIKQPEYELFMLSQNFVNVFEYADKKIQSCIVQWNLETHDVINVNYNRQIFPMLKIFSFIQSDTFCIVQHDCNVENAQKQKQKQKQKIKQPQQASTYHTKFKLAYFKFPLKKQNQKPHMVFKTHTNPKQYGFSQEIIKLNNHSMVGSISTKMNQNGQTLLKTFDFKNNPMGIEVNYKFHVQINYRKQLLQLWITDIWEIRPENFYLKCQLKIDRNKQQKYFMQYPNKTPSQTENIQQCIHLTWAYKSQNTLKFAKFKTPLLNHIQFIDNFNPKQRVRISYQKSLTKQKVIKIQPIYTPNQSVPITLSLNPSLNPINNPFNINNSTSSSMNSSLNSSTTFTSPLTPQTTSTSVNSLNNINNGVSMSTGTNSISNQTSINSGSNIYVPPVYIKSVHRLPIFFIDNHNEQIVQVQREYCDWTLSYPAFAPRTLFFYRNQKQNQKILQVVILKTKQPNNNKQMSIFLLNSIYQNWDIDLVKGVASMLQVDTKHRELQSGWRSSDMSKLARDVKSKSNMQNKGI